jgi:hypothetical protein
MQNVCRIETIAHEQRTPGLIRDFRERRWLATHHDDYSDFNACC